MKATEVVDGIVEHRAAGVAPDWLADILERLYWLLDLEFQVALDERRAAWIRGDDVYLVAVAIAFEEVAPPFSSMSEMVAEMRRVEDRWPELRAFTQRWIDFGLSAGGQG